MNLRYPYYTLALLTFLNLLNYIDRQVIYAVFPLIQDDLLLSDTALGVLASAFMIVYTIAAPFSGPVGDKWSKTAVATFSVAMWSFATAASGIARTYKELLIARSAVGIGEAGYGAVSPAILSECFPREMRGRVLSVFYMAIPIGSALGFILGGMLGETFGWRISFMMVGVPGIILAYVLWWFLKSNHIHLRVERDKPRHYAQLFKIPTYLLNMLALTVMTFVVGGFAAWMPTYFVRIREMSITEANVIVGVMTVIAGVFGTALGGWVGDWAQKFTKSAYPLLAGSGFILSIPFAMFGLITEDLNTCIILILIAEILIFQSTGPLNVVIANVTPKEIRTTAFAMNIFFIHAFGDAISPTIIGYLSDYNGLQQSLLIMPSFLAISGLLCFIEAAFIKKDLKSE
ncbi:MAG: MFS transporter [Nitrospirota bacterium]